MNFRFNAWILFLFILIVQLTGCSMPPPEKCVDKCILPPPKPICDTCSIDYINDLKCQVKDGYCYAALALGHVYLTGQVEVCRSCVPKDLCYAMYWFRIAANACIPLAYVQLGHFYRDGLGIVRNPEEARCLYEQAAKMGEVTGMLALAEMYKGWHGITRDSAKARHWYERAMCCGSTEAEFQLGILLAQHEPDKFCKGIDLVMNAANACNPEALAALGDLYLEGRLGSGNIHLAKDYYQQSADLGSAIGAYKLGMLYSSGQGVCKDPRMAAKWFIASAERGFPIGQMQAAFIYRHGIGVPGDCCLATGWYMKAANLGIAQAELELGDLYHSGKGAPRILEEAVRRYKLASRNAPNAYADLMLSVMYEEGRGVPFDMEQSVKYYLKAKRLPHFLFAEYKIGRRYATGYGLPRNLFKAMNWYGYAAEKGFALAQIELADIFYVGEEEVAINYEKAFSLYSRAAAQGNAYAMYMVGMMWLQGQCVPQNPCKAAQWLRRAAMRGEREAQYQLGLLYLQGLGVPENPVQAYGWLKVALECVEDKTPTVIRELLNVMHPELKVRAVALARMYEAKYQKHTVVPMR